MTGLPAAATDRPVAEPGARRFLRRYVVSYGLRAFSAAGQLALSILILKAFGAERLGVFTVVVSNSMLVTLLARQGFDRTVIMFRARPSAAHFGEILFHRYTRTILFVTPVVGALNVAIFALWKGGAPDLLLGVTLFTLPAAIALSAMAAGHFTGDGRAAAAMIQQPGFPAGIASLVLAGGILAGTPPDPFLIFLAASVVVALIGVADVLRSSGQRLGALLQAPAPLPGRIRRLADGRSREFLVINFFTTFTSVFFFSYLAFFVATHDIGELRTIERVAQVLAFNLTFLNIILPGSAIRSYNANDHRAFDRAMSRVFIFQYATSLALFGGLWLFRGRLMPWLELSSPTLFLLPLLAQLINALTGPVRVLLMYLGGQGVLRVSVILETAGSALLYWTCYHRYGLNGLAWAYFLSIAVPNLVLAGIVYLRYGIVPLPFVGIRPRGARGAA